MYRDLTSLWVFFHAFTQHNIHPKLPNSDVLMYYYRDQKMYGVSQSPFVNRTEETDLGGSFNTQVSDILDMSTRKDGILK